MKTTLSTLILALAVMGFVPASQAFAAEHGTLKNNTNITITYQAGYSNPQGEVHWQSFKLAPGESHNWTVQNPQRNPLHIRWDSTLGDGTFNPVRHALATKPNGYRSGFFLVGKQVWIDTSGGAR